MSIRLPARYRAPVNEVRASLVGAERALFDVLCLSAVLGIHLPQDDIIYVELKGRLDPRPKLARGLRRILAGCPALSEREWQRAGAGVARRLTRALRARDLTARDADGNFEPLRSLLSFAPSVLAIDCAVPVHPVQRAAWTTIVRVFGAVHPSKVARIELPWVDRRRLQRLSAESRRERREDRDASGATPGISGRRLAVDPRLADDVGKALGERLEPAYIARYVFYTRHGEYFWPHTDSLLVHVNVFLCLEHRVPAGMERPSAFVAYRPDGTVQRFELRPGDVVAAHTQGLVHAREPLQEGESVTLLAIALAPRSRGVAGGAPARPGVEPRLKAPQPEGARGISRRRRR